MAGEAQPEEHDEDASAPVRGDVAVPADRGEHAEDEEHAEAGEAVEGDGDPGKPGEDLFLVPKPEIDLAPGP